MPHLLIAESTTTAQAVDRLVDALIVVGLVVAMAAAAYRIGRLVTLDTIWDGTREKLFGWLTTGRKLSVWKLKVHELLTCPFCITGWTSLAVVIGTDIFRHLPLIFLQWMTVWVGALCWWGVIDSDEGPKMEHGK